MRWLHEPVQRDDAHTPIAPHVPLDVWQDVQGAQAPHQIDTGFRTDIPAGPIAALPTAQRKVRVSSRWRASAAVLLVVAGVASAIAWQNASSAEQWRTQAASTTAQLVEQQTREESIAAALAQAQSDAERATLRAGDVEVQVDGLLRRIDELANEKAAALDAVAAAEVNMAILQSLADQVSAAAGWVQRCATAQQAVREALGNVPTGVVGDAAALNDEAQRVCAAASSSAAQLNETLQSNTDNGS